MDRCTRYLASDRLALSDLSLYNLYRWGCYMSKSLARYEDVVSHGNLVVGLPRTTFRLPDEQCDWHVYASTIDIFGEEHGHYNLFWINHMTEEAVSYADSIMSKVNDPTCYPYSMHADPKVGHKLVDARFHKIANG